MSLSHVTVPPGLAVPALSVGSGVTMGLGSSRWSPLQGESVQADFLGSKCPPGPQKRLTRHVLTQQARAAGGISSQSPGDADVAGLCGQGQGEGACALVEEKL